MEQKPLVCIECITYNHEKFIRETLEGFIMQQTTFPFVAVVHDDASTDGTADIIREYAEKYPDIIKPIYETENQYSKPGGPLTRIMYEATRATGAKYVAKCEGDDYWTSPHKLQRQVDFLESHPDYVMCTHGYEECLDETHHFYNPLNLPSQDYDLKMFAEQKIWLYQTLTLVYRFSALNIEELIRHSIRIDIVFMFLLLKNGKGRYIGDNMAVYRHHSGGVWSKLNGPEEAYKFSDNARWDLYKIQKSKEAALFMMSNFSSPWTSRRILLHNKSRLIRIFKAYKKHFGFRKAFIDFAARLIINRTNAPMHKG